MIKEKVDRERIMEEIGRGKERGTEAKRRKDRHAELRWLKRMDKQTIKQSYI